MTTQEIDSFVDINLRLNTRGSERFITRRDYFTNYDLVKLQDFIAKRYTNFNGGVGFADTSPQVMEQKIDNSVQFTFCTELQLREDITFKKRNNLTYPFEFNPRNCVESFGWLEMLIFICEDLNIFFYYHPDIIDEIINKRHWKQN